MRQDDHGWFDTHCHVQEDFEPSSGALDRAVSAGVGDIVCVGTDAASSRQALDLACSPPVGAPRISATVGLHPHEASGGIAALSSLIDESLQAGRRPVAIGECGLDYFYEHSPRAAQREVFAAQVQMALHNDLALVVHAREAWDDLFAVLDTTGVPHRSVLHCFTGGVVEARRCLDAGFLLSFSGLITFKNAASVREAALFCPMDRLLVETDSPFLAPVPHRGRRNEPAMAAIVGRFVADLKGVDHEALAVLTTASARSVFRGHPGPGGLAA
ncbi:MAG: TatD family hydrolase [Acidimicrobiales bacterium]